MEFKMSQKVQNFKTNSLVLIFIIFFSNSICEASIDSTTRNNFHSFTNEWIISSNKSAEAIDIIPGVKLFNPFGVGYLLAAINGKSWNIPTSGIDQALRTPEESIINEYSIMLKEFSSKNFSTSSVVYTRFDNITQEQEPNLSKLNTLITQVDFVNEPNKFWSIISEQISNGTNEQLKDELIPEVMWQKVFENSTQGAFINTFYHKSELDVPWKDIGDRSFNYDTIMKFYEREGEFLVLESSSFSAVQVEIQKNVKKMVFVKPNVFMNLEKIREEIQKISFTSEQGWEVRKLRVQIPALNVTNLSRNYQGLVKMGISDAFCRSNESSPEEYKFELQPIAQANHFEFSGQFVEIATATGAIINYNKYIPKEKINLEESDDEEEADDNYPVEDEEAIPVEDEEAIPVEDEEATGVEDEEATSVEDEEVIPLEEEESIINSFETRRLKFKSKLDEKFRTSANFILLEQRCENPEDFGKIKRKSQNNVLDSTGIATLAFDTPFFYIVQDKELGEIFSGVVNSLCQYKKVSEATKSTEDHTWLHDVFKVAFWKCV